MSSGLSVLDPEHRLALAYASAKNRVAFAALFQFDRVLASAVSAASEPILGQIRLSWWREMIEAARPSAAADPLAATLGAIATDHSIAAEMVSMVNGWESLLAPLPLAVEELEVYAKGRGAGLFGSAAKVAGCDSNAAERAGEGWALADFAFHCSDRATAGRALFLANARLDGGDTLPRPLLPLTILRRFARRDAARGLDRGSASGTPWRPYDALAAAIQGK